MTRKETLDAALRCVCGDREAYGTPEDNFGRIARLWEDYLGHPICPHDVAAMMALLKIARIASGQPKADNWVDLAGYAACGAELQAPAAPDVQVPAAQRWADAHPAETWLERLQRALPGCNENSVVSQMCPAEFFLGAPCYDACPYVDGLSQRTDCYACWQQKAKDE